MRSASALVLLVAVSCALWRLPADAPPAGAAPPPLPRPAAAAPAAAHIVRFREYLHAAEHRTRLEAALPPAAAGWAWVPRDNPAAALPTDFGLVRLTAGGGAGGAAALAALAALPFVRDVHADAMIRRSPLAFREEALDADLDAELDLAAGAGAFGPCAPGAPPGCVLKHPGRILTRPTFALADNAGHAGGNASAADPAAARRRLRLDAAAGAASLPVVLGADKLWAAGFDGTGIKVGIFDTGIKDDHPDVRSVEERTNWTHEPTLEDGLGHGSFVAGVVGGRDAGCPGLAQGASLHTFRVFTNDQVRGGACWVVLCCFVCRLAL
jgi:membrane-bound transcription factor site-1 protease